MARCSPDEVRAEPVVRIGLHHILDLLEGDHDEIRTTIQYSVHSLHSKKSSGEEALRMGNEPLVLSLGIHISQLRQRVGRTGKKR